MSRLQTTTIGIILFVGLLYTIGMVAGIHYMHNQPDAYLNVNVDTGVDDE